MAFSTEVEHVQLFVNGKPSDYRVTHQVDEGGRRTGKGKVEMKELIQIGDESEPEVKFTKTGNGPGHYIEFCKHLKAEKERQQELNDLEQARALIRTRKLSSMPADVPPEFLISEEDQVAFNLSADVAEDFVIPEPVTAEANGKGKKDKKEAHV